MNNPFRQLFNHLKIVKERKREQRLKTEELLESYENLINEFRLIQEKKSMLSKKQRARVELKIKRLIAKGHIKIKK